MCGISGIIPIDKTISPEKILEVVNHLLTDNQSRGSDATGIASWDIEHDKILVCKQAESAKDFITNLKTEHIFGPTIGHNRAKTRGDPSDPENNHPIFGQNYCIIHNGMVHSMANLEGYKYKGICDTEVLLSYIETFGVKGAIPKIDGSAALAIMSPGDKKFYLYKHTSPLSITYFPGKAFVFSSTEFPLKKVGDILGGEKKWGMFPTYSTIDFEEGQLLTIDLKTFAVTTEEITVEAKGYYNRGVAPGVK